MRAAALPGIASDVYLADAIGPRYHEGDLLTEPQKQVPGGGVGVELDEEQVRRWRQT
jgi:muconate cycloisomerase